MRLAYGVGHLQSFYEKLPIPLQDLASTAYGLRQRRRIYGAYFRSHLERLRESQWYDEVRLRQLQDALLVDFVAYAYAQCPYWREVFDCLHVRPEEIQTAADLSRLPILDKETVRLRAGEITSSEYVLRRRAAVSVHTSGTTGKALHLELSREAWEREYAFRQLHRSWGGITVGSRIATFAGHPVVPVQRLRPPFWRVNWAENQVIFSSQHLTPANLPAYVEKLQRFQPEMIHGYPSSLCTVARHLKAHGVHDIRPRVLYTASETLLDYQRLLLEEVFECKVFVWYGNTEVTGNIVECEQGGLHVKLEHSIIEFLREDGEPAIPGDLAHLICTGIGNYATPLIRYSTGDMAVLSDRRCPCGRSGPLVEQILGRVEDIVVTPDGRHLGRLDHAFKDQLNVVEAQIVQEEVSCIEVRIVKRSGFGEEDLAKLEAELRFRLGSAIGINYEFVDSIPRESNGKFRFVISRVPVQLR